MNLENKQYSTSKEVFYIYKHIIKKILIILKKK
jgi:hypothetical protein